MVMLQEGGAGDDDENVYAISEDDMCALSTSEEDEEDIGQNGEEGDEETGQNGEDSEESDTLVSEDESIEMDDGFSDVASDEAIGAEQTIDNHEMERELIQVNLANAGVWFERSRDGKIELKQGQLFDGVKHFREVLKDFVIQEGFELVRIKNEKTRVTVACKGDGCPWRLHASPTQDGCTFKIKTYNSTHTCLKKSAFKEASYIWIADKLFDKFAAEPSKSTRGIAQDLHDMFGITGLKPTKLFRARKRAKKILYGDHFGQYARTRSYGELVIHHNPGSIFIVSTYERESIERPIMFKRLFVVFEGVKRGFLDGCRPFMGVDGCFLKGEYGGMFLSAVALDGNNGILPLAACVAETENKDAWLYFFNLLKEAIGESYGICPWTIISDRQKGLIDAAQEVFPNVIQRCCLFHIESNFKLKFKGGALKNKLWAAGKACNVRDFNLHMQQIKELNSQAFDWLMEIPVSLWSRHAMNPISRVDHISNNVSESFNHWIKEQRDLPILSLMEGYRNKVMDRLSSRYKRATQFRGKLVPTVVKKLNSEWMNARNFDVTEAGRSNYEVKLGSRVHIVNLRDCMCDCGRWAISGLPCMHAIACIRMNNRETEEFVHSAFSVETYFNVYKNVINPQPDFGVLPMPTTDVIQPPPFRRTRGRPKKLRRLQPSEKLSLQRSTVVRCSKCKGLGHNRRRCTGIPNQIAEGAGHTPTFRTDGASSSRRGSTQDSQSNVAATSQGVETHASATDQRASATSSQILNRSKLPFKSSTRRGTQ